jgi:hypothetical protein
MRPAASEALRSELQALLTRASDCESRRQSALARGDLTAADALEREILRLYARHADLEARERCA